MVKSIGLRGDEPRRGWRGSERFARVFISAKTAADPELHRRASVVLLFSLLIVLCAPGFVAVAFYAYEVPVVGVISIGAALIAAATPIVLKVTDSVPIAAGLLTFAIVLNVALAVGAAEGLTSPALAWLALIPIFAIATAGRRAGVAWSLLSILTVGALAFMTVFGWLPDHEMPLPARQSAAAWNTVLLVVLVGGFMLLHEGLRERSEAALRKKQIELDEARQRQADADRLASIGTLAAGVGHEINNPLTYVLGNLRELRAQLDPKQTAKPSSEMLPEWRRAVDESIEGASRVAEIVGDLRAFARTEDEGERSADPVAAVRSALRITAPHWRARTRLFDELEALPPVVGPASKLIRVLVDLITRAVAAMPERPAEENEIRVRAGRAGEQVEILVEDNGDPISPDAMVRLFEPFFTSKPLGGLPGIGLGVTRANVEAAGGRLDAKSTPGRGTVFTVVLPLSERPAEPAEPPPLRDHARKERILIIEDDLLVAKVVRRLLRRRGEVVVETSGERALRLLEDEHFDWILCDIMLPGITGLQLYAKLQASRPELAERVAFMSGGALAPETNRFLEQMRDRWIEKPFAPGALEALAERMRR